MELFIATNHGKEAVFTPALTQSLNWSILPVLPIDTDQFGTFSGEIERKGSVLETLRLKCETGYAISGCPIVIASEGSFGPHPEIPFLPFFEEYMLYKDFSNGLEIMEKHAGTNTNFHKIPFTNSDDLDRFLHQIGFPEHAVILTGIDATGERWCQKGIVSKGDLLDSIKNKKTSSEIVIETDMRAHLNPTRMKEIAVCAEKLIRRIQQKCPSCASPGFGSSSVEFGLPCAACGLPTNSVHKIVYACVACAHTESRLREDKVKEDPMYCNFCNP